MREIKVSTDVFARIWALRAPNEDTEDQILKRVLSNPPPAPLSRVQPQRPLEGGFWDRRHGVHFSEGFEIFRVYKGREFSAVARGGCWELPDGRKLRSLNELSRVVTSGIENAWANWNFRDEVGIARKVSELRNEVSKRSQEVEKAEGSSMHLDPTWRNDVERAVRDLGGKAPLDLIYKEVERRRKDRGASIPPSIEAIVRRELENNSSDSQSFTGRHDLFYSVDGLGGGVWGLRGGNRVN